MSRALLPYAFPAQLQAPTEPAALPGKSQGVYFTLPSDITEELLARIDGWFAGRDEVVLVDAGTTDKQGLGFVIVEWQECTIDPLFLAILRDEDLIEDYTVYGREMGG
jgi:hypothetical protein